ncbi:MAG: hypothetical protein OXJ53_04850 [Gammaproteobacteria bacterium]|nr:hypothetical protein [Gammaproteobacteria bacterium]MDE0272659.1 hypothetical protein [Gammaproteobacteria bacterium]
MPSDVTPLRAGTVCVANVERSRGAYERLIEYRTVETGRITNSLAGAWAAPNAAGAPYALLQPPSGADTWLRLVESPSVGDFEPLVSMGWTALEFCVLDVQGLAARLADSPFEIIGPPRRLDGMDSLCAMQVRGPDGEICYFTQIDSDPPGLSLPRASSFVDRLFIHVVGASNLGATQRWVEGHLDCTVAMVRVEMVYTMLARAFDKPLDTRFTISTLKRGDEVFLQVDQMPPEAVRRPKRAGMLPPGIAMTTLSVASLDAVANAGIEPPARHDGMLYDGRRSAVLADPDGTLYELLEDA